MGGASPHRHSSCEGGVAGSPYSAAPSLVGIMLTRAIRVLPTMQFKGRKRRGKQITKRRGPPSTIKRGAVRNITYNYYY